MTRTDGPADPSDASGRSVDAVVIGLGPGGEDVAARLAHAGWSVLAVESHLVGGECPYYGCVPTKMMLHESRRPDASWSRVSARIREEATDHWDDRAAVERLERAGATFVRGRAEIEGGPAARPGPDGTTVTVTPHDGGAPGTWTARRAVVLNTGSETVLAPVPELPACMRWTHRDVVTALTLPERLAVVGAGPLGCEIAQALAGFGVEVTLLVRGERLLPHETPEAGDLVAERFRSEGIHVLTGTRITGVAASEISRYESSHGLPTPTGPVVLELSTGGRVKADRVLLATGRAPRDAVAVDEHCRVLDVPEDTDAADATGVNADGGPGGSEGRAAVVPGRYAIGDMAGFGAFTHASMAQAAVVAAQLLDGAESSGAYGDGGAQGAPGLAFPVHAVPRVTYTEPEVAAVGLSEDEARRASVGRAGEDGDGGAVRVARVDLASSTRGWIDQAAGSLTLVARTGGPEANGGGGVLVGASVVGPHAGEVIGALTVAVHARVPLAELDRIPWAYPTLHRAIGSAVSALLAPGD